MDHRAFQFATGGQCIKENKLDCFEQKQILYLICNVLALFTFYAPPSGGKWKGADPN